MESYMTTMRGANGSGVPLHAAKELVTVERAKMFLAKNSGNRPLSDGTVKRYAAQMTAGMWKFNADPVRLTADGELLDGQHRLSAIVASGKPQPMLVVYGVERSSFDTMDVGKKREAADMLGIIGKHRTIVLAAVARSLITYESGAYWTSDIDKKVKKTTTGNLDVRPTEAQVVEYVMEHPELEKVIDVVLSKYAKGARLGSPTAICVLAVLMMRENKTKAQEFLDGFSGLSPCFGTNDPRFVAREYFIRMKMNKNWSPKEGNRLAILIKAANAFFADKPLKRLSFNRTREWFPKFGQDTSVGDEVNDAFS